MTTPDGLPPLREVIAAAQLTARRSLGQNFILDLNLTRRIARAGGPLDGATVVEIGAGPGGLTRALLIEGAARVIALERDKRCLPVLEKIAAHYPGRLEIVEADALDVDYSRLVPGNGNARIIANLPYGIATELLTRWLSQEAWPPWYDRLVLMFQREVAERIVAAPGAKAYGRLAILSQWRSEARILFNLPPQAFTPKPKVASAVVELIPRAQPEQAGSPKALKAVTAAAFGQRRKMLKSSLKVLGDEAPALLEETGIDPSLRAEALSVPEFCALARALHARDA